MSRQPDFDAMSCPVPLIAHETIQLAHGAGGSLSSELIDAFILPHFASPELEPLEDQAVLTLPAGRVAFSTDTFVVDPLFFPGGDIGELAVNGTVNDVAMCGAKPLALSVGFVLEEGLALTDFHRVLCSMERAVKSAGVRVVTGDTKVVDRGSCDRMFVNTSGIGVIPEGVDLSAANLRPGDHVLVSGSIADHGMAVMTAREGLSFRSRIASDTAALNGLVETLLAACPGLRALRDPTRGGLATTLNEFARASDVGIRCEDGAAVVRPDVAAACEILGIDPYYVANEGKLVAVVPPGESAAALEACHGHNLGREAAIVGEVVDSHPGLVSLRTGLGAERIVEMPVGEQLPRIC